MIDVVAPSSGFDANGLRVGIEYLLNQGFRVRHREDVFLRDRFLAGPDERRLEELRVAVEAPDSQVIWCARGGYGSTRLLPDLSVERIRIGAKRLIGFSDVTALHALWWKAGLESVHGPMLAKLASEPEEVRSRVISLACAEDPAPLLGLGMRAGSAEGKLTGGNLALLAALCGTPHQPDYSGAIVFIEEIGERPYRLDRAFIQCAQAGLFNGIRGLVFGDFTDCDEPGAQVSAEQVLCEHADRLGVPAIRAIRSGHGPVNEALLFGRSVHIDGTKGSLEWARSHA